MGDLVDALQLAGGEAPWWAGILGLFLALAAAIARRISRRSAVPQGERLGELERRQVLEQTRRRQIEAVLRDLGVPIPYWPPDGPQQPGPRRPLDVDEDLDHEDEPMGPETIARRVPVPPLDPAVSARHRRETARNQGDY